MSDEVDKKHYVRMDGDRMDKAFDILDIAVEKIVNELHLNVFEVTAVIGMMEQKISRANIDQYLLETVTRFQEKLNEEDERGR